MVVLVGMVVVVQGRGMVVGVGNLEQRRGRGYLVHGTARIRVDGKLSPSMDHWTVLTYNEKQLA